MQYYVIIGRLARDIGNFHGFTLAVYPLTWDDYGSPLGCSMFIAPDLIELRSPLYPVVARGPVALSIHGRRIAGSGCAVPAQ